jgi:hypothetical protein
MERTLARSLCLTKFFMQRDYLSASMTRLGNGFMPLSVIQEAKHHLAIINSLLVEMESYAPSSQLEKLSQNNPEIESRDGRLS